MTSTLSTHDLTKSYGGRTVVRGVSSRNSKLVAEDVLLLTSTRL